MTPASAANLNPGQCAALDLDRDMIVSAGAGAGKTQVLGLRVLALLEEGRARIDEIVAFTFTEKAASEMRERVQRLLLARVAELEAARDKQRLPRLKQAQMEFTRNRISTVHSFCYRLLNDYAWEAGIEPRAPILDERRQASARDTAMRNVLLRADLASEPALAAALERLGTAMSLGELRATLEKLLRERNVAERALRNADERWANPDAEVQQRAERHAALLQDALAPVLAAISHIDFGAVSAATDGDTLREPVMQLRPHLKAPDAVELARILLTADQKKGRAAKGAQGKWKHAPDALDATREAWADAADAMVEVAANVPLHFDEAFERRAGGVLRDLWAVYQRVYVEYAEACAGGLDFLDLELRTLRLLHERADVRDELTRRLRYLLVDEFQDTNPTQGELFRLLTEGDDTPGRFFAVGDAKQSIYGFRGSDVSIFNRALADVPARNKRTGAAKKPLAPAWGLRCDDSAEQRGGVIRLAHNYRTAAPVLELGNRIFRRVFETDAPRPYDAQAQDMIAGSDAPAVEKAVEFHLLPKPKFSSTRDDEDTGRARKDDEAELVARRAAELHAAGTAYKDIAILVRRGTRNWEYRNAFARHNLPLLVVGESGLFETQEGLDCLNLLRALAAPADDIAMLGLLRSPFAGLSDRYLTELALRHPRHLTLLERLRADQPQSPPEAAAFLARFDAWRSRAGRDTPALLLNAALADTAYALAVGCGFDADQRLANVERVVEVVRQMQLEHPGLARLVRELLTRIESGDSEAQGAPEQEADGVRLLTTHKAKGLEFDTVIVPDTAADLRGPGGGVLREWPPTPDEPLGIWLRSTDADSLGDSQCDLAGYFAKAEADQRGAAEEKRVLYVAYTRARSRIVLVGTVREVFDKDTWADQLLRALGVHAWGDACADPAIELTWHEGVQRGEPQSHAPAIQRAREALAAGVLQLPHAPDTSLLAQAGEVEDVYVPPEAAEFGTLLHEALERRLRSADAEIGVVGDALQSHLQAATEALGTLPKARRELPEFGLITPEGAKRLDLLRVLQDGSYEIIDYKTDRVEGDLAEHAEREHGPQLRAYADSLTALLKARGAPARPVRTYVVFTGLDRLHPRQRVVEIALNPDR